MAGGGVRLQERLDVVGRSPVHCSEGQYQGLESDKLIHTSINDDLWTDIKQRCCV